MSKEKDIGAGEGRKAPYNMKIITIISTLSRALFIIVLFSCYAAGNFTDYDVLTGTYDENGAPKIFRPVKDMIKSDDSREIAANRKLYGSETVDLNSDIDTYSIQLVSDISGQMNIIDTFMKDTHELQGRRSIIDETTIDLNKSLLHERNAMERHNDKIRSLRSTRAKNKKSIETVVSEINEIKASLKPLDAGLKGGNYDENTFNEQNRTKERLVKRMSDLRSELQSQESEYDKLGKTIQTELQYLQNSANARVNYQMKMNKLLAQDAEAEILRLVKMVLPPLYAEIEKQKGILEDTKVKLGQVSAKIIDEEKLIDLKQENIKQISDRLNSPSIGNDERTQLLNKKKLLRNEIRETRRSLKEAKQKASDIDNMIKEVTALLKNYTDKKNEAEIRIVRMKRISETAANERKVLESFAIIRKGY